MIIPRDDIKTTIFNHPEFIAFGRQMDAVFDQWRTATAAYVRTFDTGVHPKQVIRRIAENLLELYSDIRLIDKYDVYQHLLDYWAETMQDNLYEIAADGWLAGNEVKRIAKKTKKGDKDIVKPVAVREFRCPGRYGLMTRRSGPA